MIHPTAAASTSAEKTDCASSPVATIHEISAISLQDRFSAISSVILGDWLQTKKGKNGIRQQIIDKSTTLSVISALLLSIYMPMMYQIQQFPDVYSCGNEGDMACPETSDRGSMSTPKTIFVVGWVVGNTCSMFALVCAFIQLLAYTETNDDWEAFEMYKKHPASRSAYLFFLAALILGCLLMEQVRYFCMT
mmetsp:Transcript_32288/g.67427  ORF Transcript_32288/g.67427 Transcript_32288/m.67427 type:complete len:192 (-) Transcript_32288:273-848(-)